MTTQTCIYNDEINEVIIRFRTDAPQKLVTSLEFSGEWCIVKNMLLDFGYIVIENINVN